jgi:hypothetical protein
LLSGQITPNARVDDSVTLQLLSEKPDTFIIDVGQSVAPFETPFTVDIGRSNSL